MGLGSLWPCRAAESCSSGNAGGKGCCAVPGSDWIQVGMLGYCPGRSICPWDAGIGSALQGHSVAMESRDLLEGGLAVGEIKKTAPRAAENCPSSDRWAQNTQPHFQPQTLPQHCPGSVSCAPLQSRFSYGANVGLCRAGCGWGDPCLKPPPPLLAVVSDLCATGDHDCEQVCVSTPGAYRCACRDGFSLNSDGKTCTACNGGLGSALDLVFLIDGSKSVRPENFELVKKFINQIVDSLEVSDKQAQVGLVQYSSSVRQEFPLGQFKSKKDIKAAVKKMSYMEKGTMTGQALKYLVDSSFSVINGARPGVPKVGIVFTDGRSQDYISDAAKKAKDSGFRMFAVGVGNAVEDELREIASEPVAEHYFYTADFRTISKIGKKLQMKICVEEDPCECKSIMKFQTKVEELINSLQQKHILWKSAVAKRIEALENKII
uniref:Matrilin 1 n=1 Tax=Zonotrichia albicollis TaxID=44394 RepID=A0A8D2N889_ZONAL